MTNVPSLSKAQRKKLAERLTWARSDRSDTGSVLPLTKAALAIDPAPDRGAARLEALVEALAAERIIVPVEVEPASDQGGTERVSSHHDIDFARTVTALGEALVVFSSKSALALARPSDRPMAFDTVKAALAALVETGGHMVLDPGASEILIPRPAVAALAQKDAWLPAWKDTELLDQLRECAQVGFHGITDLRLSYGGEGLIRVELFVDGAAQEQDLRASVVRAAREIAASKRLAVGADKVEIIPRPVR